MKDATLTMGLILVSRLLGFVRERAVAEVFGRTAETDAFRAAFNIPDLMYSLLVGGAITAAFIPVFAGYLARGEEEDAWRVASTFLNVTAGLLVSITLVGMAAAPYLAPLVAYGFGGTQRALLVELMRFMFPAVLFTGVAGLGMGVLNSYRRFSVPLLGPIVYNLAIIAGAYGLGPRMGIRGMAVGTLAGALANAVLQWTLVFWLVRGWRPHVNLRDPAVRRLYRLMLPAMLGLSVTQLSLIVSSNLASTLPAGSITALNVANRLMQFPLGVFAMGMSTVLFPSLAGHVALGQMQQFGQAVVRGLQGVLFLTVPSAVGLAVLARPVVRLLFEAGAFSARDTQATAAAVVFYSAALVGQSAIQILTRAFYSLNDTRTPVLISTAALVINAAMSLATLRWTGLGHGGLALAFSLTSLSSWALYLFLLRRRVHGLSLGELGSYVARVVVACLPMGAAAWAVAGWSGATWGVETLAERALQVGAATAAGAVAYAVAANAMGLPEVRRVTQGARRALLAAGQRGGRMLGHLVRRLAGAGSAGSRP